MFLNDVHKKEEIRNIAIQQLRKYGIKYRPKKARQNLQDMKHSRKFFKVPLQKLDTQTVTLEDGRQLIVPKLVDEMCSYILTKVETEGIFRKEGSKSRQNEIKLSIDRGCPLGDEHHVIDVAAVLKFFLRELPEPLIPSSFHELFLRCSIIHDKLNAIYLACLLLPTEHLNVLSYLMQFFSEVARSSDSNKMNVNNLSILIGPNVFPIDEKVAPKSQQVLAKTCDIVKMLIENSRNLGVIPDHIMEMIGNMSSNEDLNEKRKKKRRSGSLTRMFNGLKKIVSNKNEDTQSNIVTPDLLVTPSMNRSLKKRKHDYNALSAKKRKDILAKLPESTPYTPMRTPISANPNPKSKLTASENNIDKMDLIEETKEKKSQWYTRTRSVKSLKDEAPKSMLERRWSVVSQAANFAKKKRNSFLRNKEMKKSNSSNDVLATLQPESLHEDVDGSFVKVRKAEYEEIKNRVSAIERRISIELDQQSENQNNANAESIKEVNIQSVQNAYEQALETIEPMSPTTDLLARRLSRELRIRRNSEQKIIRSPSARKIGTLRRRSRELEKQSTSKLQRNQSWHVNASYATNNSDVIIALPRVNLKRGKPNTLSAGLPTPTKSSDGEVPSVRITRSTSFHINNSNASAKPVNSSSTSSSSSSQWTSAEGFFDNMPTPSIASLQKDRASIAKLRYQNAGMVLAKARLFDNLDSDQSTNSSGSSISSQKSAMPKGGDVKIGACMRNADARMSYRIRALKAEERRSKKSMSPRRRHQVSHRQKLHIAKQYVEAKENVECASPVRGQRTTPRMVNGRKSVAIKSPKRLCRTPPKDRKTPLKVLSTPRLRVQRKRKSSLRNQKNRLKQPLYHLDAPTTK